MHFQISTTILLIQSCASEEVSEDWQILITMGFIRLLNKAVRILNKTYGFLEALRSGQVWLVDGQTIVVCSSMVEKQVTELRRASYLVLLHFVWIITMQSHEWRPAVKISWVEESSLGTGTTIFRVRPFWIVQVLFLFCLKLLKTATISELVTSSDWQTVLPDLQKSAVPKRQRFVYQLYEVFIKWALDPKSGWIKEHLTNMGSHYPWIR